MHHTWPPAHIIIEQIYAKTLSGCQDLIYVQPCIYRHGWDIVIIETLYVKKLTSYKKKGVRHPIYSIVSVCVLMFATFEWEIVPISITK